MFYCLAMKVEFFFFSFFPGITKDQLIACSHGISGFLSIMQPLKVICRNSFRIFMQFCISTFLARIDESSRVLFGKKHVEMV